MSECVNKKAGYQYGAYYMEAVMVVLFNAKKGAEMCVKYAGGRVSSEI